MFKEPGHASRHLKNRGIRLRVLFVAACVLVALLGFFAARPLLGLFGL